MNVPEKGEAHGERHSSAAKPRVGALLVHGLNGSKHDMEEIEVMLCAYGVVVVNMVLPGHGTHVRNMLAYGWPDWAAAVRSELRELKRSCDSVFLVGHSLGGALCLHTAVHEEVAGVIAMCAPLHLHPWMRPLVRVAKYVTPLLPTVREDVCDPVARRRHTRNVYRWTPMAPVESMLQYLPQLRRELPQIMVPVLVMAAVHDHVVPIRDGREIYRLLGSQEKQFMTLYRSYHVIMKDYEREMVFARTLAFVQRHYTHTSEKSYGSDKCL